ncbi:glycosyltransferase [Adlercreutzia sp. ZJ141]|uniref:glycosyltransferase n=1 Tax=Adlercreutzia sp. ZJ141 TaxID=2709406 RepID=UPI0013EC5912|nr:glycosyltransferase [Adlercreutzia sp. ZJ141]
MGGVKRFIINAAHALDADRYDVCILSIGALEGDTLGLKVDTLLKNPADALNLLMAADALQARLREMSPDIVHIHGNNGVALLYAEAAKRAGQVVRVVHSHNSSLGSDELYKRLADSILKQLFADAPTARVACSRLAGDWLFADRPYAILRNGIDVERFVFSHVDRGAVRDELGIPRSAAVLVLVGAGIPAKNTRFAIRILAELLSRGSNVHLLLVGEGIESCALRAEVDRAGLSSFSHFVGTVGDVWRYYSSADVLLMPSRYEGLPIALVEAQANGLPCLVSDVVSSEADVAGLLRYLPLGDISEWAHAACEAAERGFGRDVVSTVVSAKAVRTAGFSLEDLGLQLSELYKEGGN